MAAAALWLDDQGETRAKHSVTSPEALRLQFRRSHQQRRNQSTEKRTASDQDITGGGSPVITLGRKSPKHT